MNVGAANSSADDHSTGRGSQGLIHRLDHLFNDLLGVAKDHQVLVQLEEFVAETHIVAGHGSLVDDDRLGPEGYRR